MKKTIKLLLAVALLLLNACYNDNDLQISINELDARVSVLEQQSKQLNTNIASLQTILTGLQNRDYITNVTPLTENGVEVGYTLTFAKTGVVTIRHGKAGADGKAPQIGVKAGTDGQYYWTLDDNFLKDVAGNNIPASGKDGTDGVAPQVKIENGYWFLSADKGATWRNLGQAIGASGQGGKSFFQGIAETEKTITLTLADGTSIVLPKEQALAIEFGDFDEIVINAEETVTLTYTVKGVKNPDKLIVKTFVQNGWSASVTPDTPDKLSGKLTVTAPHSFTNKDEVLVWVYDGDENAIMSSINFVTGIITPANVAYIAESAAGTIEVKVETNLQFMVEIPAEAQSWVSLSGTRATRTETLSFSLAANEGAQRTAFVTLKSESGRLIKTIVFVQKGATTQEESIVFYTKKAISETILLQIDAELADRGNVWIDLNNNGVRDMGEDVSSFSSTNVYSSYTISSQVITIYGRVTRLICSNNELAAIDIGNAASLMRLVCSNNQLTELDVTRNTPLLVLWCDNNKLTSLDVSNNPNLIQLVPRNNQLTELNLNNNTALLSLDCSYNPFAGLDFSNNIHLTSLYCNGANIRELDVSRNTALTTLSCSNNHLAALDVSQNSALHTLYCYGNHLNADAVTALITSLPMRTNDFYGWLGLLLDADENNAPPTSANIIAANNKYWGVMRWTGSNWFEMTP